MKILLQFSLLLALASCGITAPRDVGNDNMITLDAPDDITSAGHKQGVLKVDYPSAPSDLDTYRIAVTKPDGRPDYFAGARWNEFLPSVVQAALSEAITRSGRFTYVDSGEGSTNNNYMLSVDIEDCRAVYHDLKAPPQIVMAMVFHLSASHSDASIATFRLEEKTDAESNTLSAISKAFNASFASIAGKAISRLQSAK